MSLQSGLWNGNELVLTFLIEAKNSCFCSI